MTSTPLPEQGGFNERLDEILRTYTADKEWARTKVENHADYTEHTNECGVCNKMQQLTDQAKAAIRTLVLEEIIGEDERPAIEASPLMKRLSPDTKRIDWRNQLRIEQRKKLGGQ